MSADELFAHKRSHSRSVRVVARERGQIHAGDGAQQPGQLPIFLYGSPGDQSGGAAFGGTGVYAHGFNPFEVERSAAD